MKNAVEKSRQQFSVLSEIGWPDTDSLKLDEILQEGLNLTLAALEIGTGGIFLLEDGAGELRPHAHCGMSAGLVDEFLHLQPDRCAALEGEAVTLAPSGRMNELLAASLRLEGFTSAVLVPLIASSEVVGILMTAGQPSEPILYADMDFLTAVGRRLGQAIYYARIFGRLQSELNYTGMVQEYLERQADAMKALYETFLEINAHHDIDTLLQAIVRRAVALLHSAMGAMYVMDPDGQSLRLTVGHNLPEGYLGRALRVGEGLSGKVAQSGKTQVVKDYQAWDGKAQKYKDSPFRRVVAAPLRSGGEVIGVITVSDEQTTGFSDDDIRLLNMFANQAALAVEKARLYKAERLRAIELGRANVLLSVLGQVSILLESTVESGLIMEKVGAKLQENGFGTLIALLDKASRELVVQYVSTPPDALLQAESMLGVRLLQMHFPRSGSDLFTHRRPVFESDPASLVAAFLPQARQRLVRYALNLAGINEKTTAIGLPLVVHDQVMGLMAVWGNDLNVEDISIFFIFANQVAAALENARLYASIQHQAIVDELTGLYNRRGFFALAEQQMRALSRMKKTALLIFVDVDGMKHINDTLGHQAGDRLLVDTATILKKNFRESDIVARMGGDEFAILALESTEANPETLSRLESNLSSFNQSSRRPYQISFSVGTVSWTPDKPLNLDDLLIQADRQMYLQKRTKKTPKAE